MKTKNIILSIGTLFLFVCAAFNSDAQSTNQNSTPASKAKIEVIQFHSEHRCMTCNRIEQLTRSTLKKEYASIPFVLFNVDEKKNEKLCEEFEATGTSLFLYNPSTGSKKNLTDFAFMNAGDADKFINGLRKEIDAFEKQ
jgi:hypothetical protein